LKKYFLLFLGFCFLAPFLFFFSCELYGDLGDNSGNTEGSLPALLTGTWSSGTDGYVISADTLSYDEGINGGMGYSYTGTIRYVSNFTPAAGIIIIEYTAPPFWTEPPGSFFGVYYRNLTRTSVQLANSINPDRSAPETRTLEEAAAKFTQAREGDFVNWGIVQSQRRQ
jgi:hypothetical protein